MKRLLIIFVALVFILFSNASNQPTVELLDEDTIKMIFTENGTVSASQLSSVTNTTMPEVRVVSTILSANCTQEMSWYKETLYEPQYYIFAPHLSGKDCLCQEEMYRKTKWEYYMFGYLYQPQMAWKVNTGWVEYDKCLATNCYTSGMLKLGEVQFIDSLKDWEPKYDAEIVVYLDDERNELHFDEDTTEQKVGNMTVQFNPKLECDAGEVVIYNNEVKHARKYSEFSYYLHEAQTDFRKRIENRDYIVSEISNFIEDKVEGCSVVNGDAVCAPSKESTYTTILLNLD